MKRLLAVACVAAWAGVLGACASGKGEAWKKAGFPDRWEDFTPDQKFLAAGILYVEGHKGNDPAMRSKGVATYRELAAQGHADSQYVLALIYVEGDSGVLDKDGAEAARLFEAAARQGHKEATYRTFVGYYEGEGVAKDEKTAMVWLLAAANLGVGEAQRYAAVAYATGQMTGRKDPEAAVAWLEKAAANGDEESKKLLAELEGTGGAAPAPAKAPAAAAKKASGAELDLGVPYEVLTGEIRETHARASARLQEGRDLFFLDGGQRVNTAEAGRAREMFDAAVREVSSLERRRARAFERAPVVFVELEYVAFVATGNAGTAALVGGDRKAVLPALERQLEIGERSRASIAEALAVPSLSSMHARYRELDGKFREAMVGSHVLAYLECDIGKDSKGAERHRAKAIELAQSEQEKTMIAPLLRTTGR
jgi:TPR repeat protein